MSKLKTLKDLKVGDFVYVVHICWICLEMSGKEFWSEDKFRITDKDDSHLYYIGPDSGKKRSLNYKDVPMVILDGHNPGETTFYSTMFVSSYSINDNSHEIKREINKLLHNFFIELGEFIQKRLYAQINLKNEYEYYGEIKTEYQEKIVEVPVETKIEVNKNMAQKFEL